MPIFQTPDGAQYEVKELTPDVQAWAQQAGAQQLQEATPGPSPLVDSAKGLASGLAEGAMRTPFLISDLLNLGYDTINSKFQPEFMQSEGMQRLRENHKGSGWIDELLAQAGTGFYKPQTGAGRIVNAVGQGAGGGLLAGGLARAGVGDVARGTAVGAIGGGSGQGLAEAVATPGEDPNPVVALVGSLLGGGAAAMKLGKTGTVNRELNKASRGLSDKQFAEAGENLQKMNRTGARSGTLGEAFTEDTPLLGLQAETVAKAGDTRLAGQVANRTDDLRNLEQTTHGRIGGQESVASSANAARDAASERLKQLRGLRSRRYASRIDKAPQVPEKAVEMLYDTLMQRAGQVQSQVDRDALEAVAGTLLQANPKIVQQVQQNVIPSPKIGKAGFRQANQVQQNVQNVQQPQWKTDIRSAAKDLKQLQDELEVSDYATGGKKLNAGAVREAYRVVNDYLKMLSPEFRAAEEDFAGFSAKFIDPATSGVIGQVAGKNPNVAQPAPLNRLEAITKGQSPEDAGRALKQIAKGVDPTERGQFKKDVVGSLLKNRNPEGTKHPSFAMRGLAGSQKDAQNQALFKAAGLDPRFIGEPMDVMDLLDPQRMNAGIKGAGGDIRGENMRANLGSTAAAPFAAAARWFRNRTADSRYREIADLLGNPSQENLDKLHRIAREQPEVRAALARWGITAGANTVTNKEE